MSAFVARYAGPCAAGCGVEIQSGDDVVYVDDELVHADCEELALLPSFQRAPGHHDELKALFARPAAETCTRCWLEKPCPCEDEQ